MISPYHKTADAFSARWWQLQGVPETEWKTYDAASRKRNERQIEGMVADLEARFDKQEMIREEDKAWVKQLVLPFAARFAPFESNFFLDDRFDRFIDAAREFVVQARAFDPSMTIRDITQAVRNLWVINVIQLALGKTIGLTPCGFAYSMLYPFTDNFLDNCKISREEKLKTIARFGQKLRGENIEPASDYERQLWRLVEKMEAERERSAFKPFYKSLVVIHEAQISSLSQHDMTLPPYCSDIVGLSMLKGGCSVVVDGYIAEPGLNELEFDRIFEFGALLQLIDDLQDTHSDRCNAHITMFSQLAGKWKLDDLAGKLILFTENTSREFTEICPAIQADLQKLIYGNCMLLIHDAIIKNRRYFSGRMVKLAESRLFVSPGFFQRLKKKIRKRNKGNLI